LPVPTQPVYSAIAPWSDKDNSYYLSLLHGIGQAFGFGLQTKWSDLTKEQQEVTLFGAKDPVYFQSDSRGSEAKGYHRHYSGVLKMLQRNYQETNSDSVKSKLEQYLINQPCATCKGQRLQPASLSVSLGQYRINELAGVPIRQCLDRVNDLQLTNRQALIGELALKEIRSRLQFLLDVGLDYLTLDRAAMTLSGGEAQRIRLATQIGAGLTGVLYVLDEPKAGVHGGDIVLQGDLTALLNSERSLTGAYLSGKRAIATPAARRKGKARGIILKDCHKNNLQHIDVEIPLGKFVCITGVSGSGKSTLVNELLHPALKHHLSRKTPFPQQLGEVDGLQAIDKVITIDQSPIGRTPRSNTATYTGVFDAIRAIFVETIEAKARGYKAGRFSFNVKGGRCEACSGQGVNVIEMNFLPDVYVQCDVCKGARYNRETLQAKYKGYSIADVLNMTVEEALETFANIPRAAKKLQTLLDVGLGYVKLGQPAPTLSGGEAQRVKLASELSRRATGKTLYLIDEPTTGLSFYDVHQLLNVLQRLVDKGNSLIVIEHNMDVIRCSDWIIDLGPEGGDKGGEIIAAGTPETVAKNQKSYTGKYLKQVLQRYPAVAELN